MTSPSVAPEPAAEAPQPRAAPAAPARIDVLIPVWNRADTVRSAIESIRQQTVRDIRIVVVDDGSTDETPAILEEMAAADPRILVLTQPNGGIVAALNFGLEHCEAEFVARHDADDLAYPHRFNYQLRYMGANPDCVAMGGWARHMAADGTLLDTYARHGPPENADPSYAPAIEPHLMHPFLMVRREAMEAVGGYRYVYHAEDADLYWRLAEVGRLYNPPEELGLYRMHADSITSRSIQNGRVQSVCSQLAAISARRRREGAPDLSFPRAALDAYHGARSFAEMVERAALPLTPAERRWLRVAAAAKLLTSTRQRPYEPDRSDCLFARRALARGGAEVTRGNYWTIKQLTLETALRLIRKRRFVEAACLYPARFGPRLLRKLLRVRPRLRSRSPGASSPVPAA